MPEIYDERGEPIGEEEMPAAPPEVAPSPQMRPATGYYPQAQIRPQMATPPGPNTVATPQGNMIVPMGGSGAGPSPRDWSNANDYMAQMAKVGRLDKAEKDVEQAMRFLGMRGVERDVQSGVPYPQALSKHLPYLAWGSPQHAQAYSKIIDAAAPPAPLSMQDVNGVQVLRTPKGDRIVPRNAIPQPEITSARTIPLTDPSGNPVPGYFAVPSPTGRGFTAHQQKDTEPKLTPGQQRLSVNDAIKDKTAEIEAVPWAAKNDKAGQAERKAKLDVLNAELEELRAMRPSLLKKKESKASGPPVPPKADRKIGQVYQTPKGPHKWTADGWVPAA